MNIGIIGGTGKLARGLAPRLVQGGCTVVLGSRDPVRSKDLVREIEEQWGLAERLSAGDIAQAAACDVIILSLPPDVAIEVAQTLSAALAGKTVVSPLNDLVVVDGERRPARSSESSLAAALASALPSSFVATAFNHVPAGVAANPGLALDADVLICTDHAESVKVVRRMVGSIDGLRPVHAGSLALAGVVEAFTAALINVNVRERRRASLCLTEQGR